MSSDDTPQNIDASTFQRPLAELAEVISQKLRREAHKLFGPTVPGFVGFDLHVQMRQTQRTYDLLFYLNADERRNTDCYWRQSYTMVVLPLIRNMIDSLYNITVILEEPARNGPRFRKAGCKKLMMGFDDDQSRYGGNPDWDEFIRRGRKETEFTFRQMGLTLAEVMAEKSWPTLGQYLREPQAGQALSPHQVFLKTLLFGHWREYSGMAHGGFDGLAKIGVFYVSDFFVSEERPTDDQFLQMLSVHLAQAAGIVLSIVTEVQVLHVRRSGH